jgi:aryl-phospho-beta-D-glucosidase BglC (GH1 family)
MANQPWTIGVNLSSAEYTFSSFPTDSDLNYLQSEGVTLVRLPIAWELMQHTLYGALDPTYLAGLKSFLDDAAAHGIQAIVDLHNYGGYSTNINDAGSGNGQKIGTAAVPISAFTDLWTRHDVKWPRGFGRLRLNE